MRRDPSTEARFLGTDIEHQIRVLEDLLGIRTDAQRALELSLFMEDKFRDVALIAGQRRPETIFDGPEGWASWLDARVFARQHLDQPLTVEFMQEVHRRLRIRHDPDGAGQMNGSLAWGFGPLHRSPTDSERRAIEEHPLLTYVPGPFRTEPHGIVLDPQVEGQPGARVVRWLDEPLTPEQAAAINADPLVGYREPGMPTREHGAIVYPNFGSVEGTREFLESLCQRCETATATPGNDPYRTAAELQRDFVAAHAFRGDFHGRHSRIIMDFVLERSGVPPSAVTEFDNDLLTSSSEWSDAVKAGSDRYGQWQNRHTQLGEDADPVTLFDLESMRERYQELGGPPSPFAPGEQHDTGRYEQVHSELTSGHN